MIVPIMFLIVGIPFYLYCVINRMDENDFSFLLPLGLFVIPGFFALILCITYPETDEIREQRHRLSNNYMLQQNEKQLKLLNKKLDKLIEK